MARRLNAFFKLRPDAHGSYIQPQVLNTGDLLDALTKQTEENMDRYACSEAVDCMEAYYKVSCDEHRGLILLMIDKSGDNPHISEGSSEKCRREVN